MFMLCQKRLYSVQALFKIFQLLSQSEIILSILLVQKNAVITQDSINK